MDITSLAQNAHGPGSEGPAQRGPRENRCKRPSSHGSQRRAVDFGSEGMINEGVESLAVCLLHSYINPHNERILTKP